MISTDKPKVSVITACYNSELTISKTLDSVAEQDYGNIEHVIIDGGSQDGTMRTIDRSARKPDVVVSEPDRGIYHAFNKGIANCTGDIIGFLHSDDKFFDKSTVSKIVKKKESMDVDSVFGDAVFQRGDKSPKISRYFNSGMFSPGMFRFGLMPAHTTFFASSSVYKKSGNFKEKFKISADFELMVRLFHTEGISFAYLNEPLCVMALGGNSTNGLLKSNWKINREMVDACRDNGIITCLPFMAFKIPLKVAEVVFAERIYKTKIRNSRELPHGSN